MPRALRAWALSPLERAVKCKRETRFQEDTLRKKLNVLEGTRFSLKGSLNIYIFMIRSGEGRGRLKGNWLSKRGLFFLPFNTVACLPVPNISAHSKGPG